MDEKIAEVTELRRQLNALRDRVNQLEAVLFRAVVAIGVAALVLGYVVPFLITTEGKGDSISLLPAVFDLGDTGGGPFSGEAAAAAAVAGVFALAILVTLIALLRLFGNQVGSPAVRLARICGIILLVACGCAWLLVFALAGHFDGRVSAFSPATFSITVGGAAALLAVALHPGDWRGSATRG